MEEQPNLQELVETLTKACGSLVNDFCWRICRYKSPVIEKHKGEDTDEFWEELEQVEEEHCKKCFLNWVEE